MDFSVQCAYVHGTSALRTHLDSTTPEHMELAWRAFSALRKRWAGMVSLAARFLMRCDKQAAGAEEALSRKHLSST